VTLTLLPSSTLPGLPVGFLLTIANPSPQPQTLSDFIRLKVSTPTGTFSAGGLRRETTLHLPGDQLEKCSFMSCLTIPGNGERQLYVRFGPMLVQNEFFADRRLSSPGRYDLRATLSLMTSPGGPLTDVDSDTQTLTIQQPTGADLAVWTFLQQSSGNAWSEEDWIHRGDTVASEIRSTYPTSQYAPWVAAIGPPTTTLDTKLARLDAGLSGNPAAALRDELLLEKGGILEGLSRSALTGERDADKALSLAEQARAVFTELRNVALTAYMRAQANDALAHLVTRPNAFATIRSLADHDPPAPAAVVPRVECVQPGPGQSFTARFGYTNPNRVLKVLQIGADNQVTPAPRETGQPRVFAAGNHSNVFVASSPGGNLTWHLDGNKATATAAFPQRCSP
jgi:hypothetical protein